MAVEKFILSELGKMGLSAQSQLDNLANIVGALNTDEIQSKLTEEQKAQLKDIGIEKMQADVKKTLAQLSKLTADVKDRGSKI